ncbi:EamA family transporter [Paenibacillus sp. MBLB4367]|uniref:EamA family transporter n=1 Tax=Paenibacillus sp. MBLB4367 TaxID=3384767 RepID=UPI003907E955
MNKTVSMLMLCANIGLLVTGQILFKWGLQKAGGFQLQKIATSFPIISGLILYGVATILWFAVLTRMPLSVAYPLQSTAYVLGMLAAWLVFREVVTPTQWAGMGVILVGVYLIAK